MEKALLINDLSCVGKCSLTVSIPIISTYGIETVPLPTCILSNQTYFKDYLISDCSKELESFTKLWTKQDIKFNTVYTGFFNNYKQIDYICDYLKDKNVKLFVDPVLGDNGNRFKCFDEKRFVDVVKEVVKANIDYVPPYNSGASLYLRPYIFGTNPILGVKPASEYEFRIFGSPVGPYFAGDKTLKRLFVSSYDRAAPHGTGNIKAGLNYAMSLRPYVCAHKAGYDENLYLDSASRTYIEETGGANILFIDKNNKVVTPKSDSILPSITRKSVLYVAKHYLNLEIEERPINVNELDNFAECGLCGTAAVIAPVGSITYNDKEYEFKTGPIVDKLRDMLLGIQKGAVEAPDGWIVEVK